jgi:hypothetical protein
MKPEAIAALKKELEKNFGRKITSYRDCVQLVEDIYQKTDSTVNVNTIRRFFGLVKTAYNPSPATLAIFARYCGFNAIENVENIAQETSTETTINKEEVYHYLLSLFSNMPVVDNPNPVTDAVLQQTVGFLERNPFLIDRFQREIAVTPAGQYYYFERYVNMDRLNDYYGDGLRYYVRAKNTEHAKIFANSLFVFRYWLTGDTALQQQHMDEMDAIYSGQEYTPLVMGRFFAAKLYHAHSLGVSPEKVLNDALKYYGTIAGKKGLAFNPQFELLLCEALALTNQKTEALEWLNRGKYFLPDKELIPESYSLWENILKQAPASVINRNFLMTYKKNQKKNKSAGSIFNKNYIQTIRIALSDDKKNIKILQPLIEVNGYRKLLALK